MQLSQSMNEILTIFENQVEKYVKILTVYFNFDFLTKQLMPRGGYNKKKTFYKFNFK